MIKCYTLLLLLSIAVSARAQNIFVIQHGATLTTTGGVVITLQDMDLQNDGTLSQAAGAGKFFFSGVNTSLIKGASQSQFDTLEIAKTGKGELQLTQSVSIGSLLRFTAGPIELAGANVFLQPAALLGGESETSHLFGTSGNYVQVTAILNTPVDANPGGLGAIITSSQNLGSTIIRRGNGPQQVGGGGGPGIARYYNIQPANDNALDATLRLMYLKGELNDVSERALTLWKSTDSLNYTDQGATSRDMTSKYVELKGISDLSFWTLAAAIPLPVQFLDFSVQCTQRGVVVRWQTAQEQNSKRFQVQFSADGSAWTTRGVVAAAGNSSVEKSYSFTDTGDSISGYYRVAELDFDGDSQYTAVRQVACTMTADNLISWTNPVRQQLTISLSLPSADHLQVSVFDDRGAPVLRQSNTLAAGINQFNIDMSRLAPGIYFVHLQYTGSDKILKVLKAE